MDWPVYFKNRLIVSNTKSTVGIVTLWTPKELIFEKLDNVDFSLMGQLYTKKGINYILRNILAHPVITQLYIVGNDLMGSGETLMRFIKNGVDDDYKIIGDDIGMIDKEIPRKAIEDFRKNVEVVDRAGQVDVKLDGKGKGVKGKAWRPPLAVAMPQPPKISTFPSEQGLYKITRPTVADAYLSILKHINMFGRESEAVIHYVSDTSKKMKELTNMSVVITDEDPNDFYVPKFLPFTKSSIDSYMKGFFNHDRGNEDYTYGERLFNFASDEIDGLRNIYPWLKIDRFKKYFHRGGIDQVAISIVRKLKHFPGDRGAIALLANPFTDVFPRRPPKKIPCLFLIQCQIYQKKLNLTAYFRSNDMYNAWALNAFALRKLQYDIANELKVKAGPLVTVSNMAHIYEHNFSDAEDLVKKHYKDYCEWDARGNFIVKVNGSEIVVKLMSPSGDVELNRWSMDGKVMYAARKLSMGIEADLGLSTLGNAMYIGRQLERAEVAVKLGKSYKQDTPLSFP